MSSPSPDPLIAARDWLNGGLRVALATVIETWGSAPRPVGSQLAINEKGDFAGSVSGGCVDSVLISEAIDVISEGAPQIFTYGVGDDRAAEVRLSCGGTIRVLVEAIRDPAMIDTCLSHRPVARIVDLASGAWTFAGSHPNPHTNTVALSFLQRGASACLHVDNREVVVISHLPPRRMIIVGAVHITQALAPMAACSDFSVTVLDPRPAFAKPARLPGISLICHPVAATMATLMPDANTAVITLAHDPLLDDPALIAALDSPAFYIGCLGSRRSHAKRVDRLRAAGMGDAAINRLHGPVGLMLGGQSPGEIAVSIIAGVIAARYAAP